MFPFGRDASGGTGITCGAGWAAGDGMGVSPGGGGTVLCWACICPPDRDNKMDSRNAKRLIGAVKMKQMTRKSNHLSEGGASARPKWGTRRGESLRVHTTRRRHARARAAGAALAPRTPAQRG